MELKNLTTDESTYSKLTSADGEDLSQPKVVKPSRIEGRFGSQNPYLLEGAKALPSTNNKYFEEVKVLDSIKSTM